MFFDDCKFTKMPLLAIGVILALFVVGGTLGFFMGEVAYNYEINKCKYLKTSSYNFDFKIERDANYAQSCYFYNNHPFAKFIIIASRTFTGFLIMLIPIFIIWGYYDMKEFRKTLNRM